MHIDFSKSNEIPFIKNSFRFVIYAISNKLYITEKIITWVNNMNYLENYSSISTKEKLTKIELEQSGRPTLIHIINFDNMNSKEILIYRKKLNSIFNKLINSKLQCQIQ